MLTRSGLARRKLLERASGSILLLPLLRVLEAGDAKAATNLTKRVIFVHFGSGTYEDTFWPTGNTGPIGTLPYVTSPLEGLKNEMILFHGLKQIGAGNHGGGQWQVLAGFGAYTGPEGNTPDTSGAVPNAYSIDQIIADKWNSPLMNVGIKSNSKDASYTKTISFNSKGQQMLAEDNPNAVFDKYFGNFQAPGGNQSNNVAKANVVSGRKRLLDYLRADLKFLKDNLGPGDREALEYHVSAIDQLNAELNQTMNPGGEMPLPSSCDPNQLVKVPGVSGNWYHDAKNTPAVYTLQRKIIAQAFACNVARVATLQMGLSQLNGHILTEGIPELSNDHHMLAHGDNDQALKDFARIQQGQMKEIALLAQDLKSSKVGDHTSFDETLIYVATDIGAPATHHWSDNIATFMLGNLGGTMKGNRLIKIKGRPYNHALVTAAHLLGLTDVNEVGYTKHAGPIKEVFT